MRGSVHTDGIENFWSLLKRTIKGTYVAVEPFHLGRYLGEQAFRFNERKDNDFGRFAKVVASIIGKRLTYAELTGMPPRKPPPESPDAGAANESESPEMKTFAALAKGLFGVSRADLTKAVEADRERKRRSR